MNALPRVILKAGREKSLLHRHPWVFSGAIERVENPPGAGETVQVCQHDGTALAVGAFSPASQIRVRIWSFSPDTVIDMAWFETSIARAVARRGQIDLREGRRLIHAESDAIAGLVVDRFGQTLVVGFLAAGAEHWRSEIVAALQKVTGIADLYERSDADVRSLEGLTPRVGVLAGQPPTRLQFVENGLTYHIDIATGHKTGFYLDQRGNRALIGRWAKARRVLNCFCYTGGFTLEALRGGASEVLSIDSSAEALSFARKNAAANGLENQPDVAPSRYREADVFTELRTLRDRAERFDLIVLDPPKFAPTERHVDKAARAYKDINLLALKLLNPGGLLATFSCSGAISADLFRKIIAGAAIDAHVDAVILEHLHASDDHPHSLTFPEGDYLKGLLVRRY
jgi:23S rRNA (cytosine1962-C5)-methyltransferase